jgi:hypothetical protein
MVAMPTMFSWVRGKREVVRARQLPILLQGILHIAAVYVVARTFVPWLLLKRASDSLQYFASHMFLFGLVAGIVIGFVNGRLWRHSIVRFIWIFPVLLLALAIVFSGPGVYPTMPFESNWGQAFRFYLAPISGIPADRQNLFAFPVPLRHVYLQLHVVLPAIVGASYSLGALLSGLMKIPIPELCFKTKDSEPNANS